MNNLLNLNNNINSDVHIISPYGVKLQFFDQFINDNGGIEVFQNLSTTDVCDKILKPITKNSKLSLVQYYMSRNNENNVYYNDNYNNNYHNNEKNNIIEYNELIGQAQWFVSHAWKYKFLDVLNSLKLFFRNKNIENCVIVWFDLFTNSQHETGQKPFNWWTTTFKESIKAMKNVVMITLPWNNPITLTRAWCVFEVYSTYIKHVFI